MTYFTTTPTGRLKAPKRKQIPIEEFNRLNFTVNGYGDPAVKTGDYSLLPGNGASAGTVGKVVSVRNYCDDFGHHNVVASVETLDGKITETWSMHVIPIPYSAVQEVKDFYINDGRANRIKVIW